MISVDAVITSVGEPQFERCLESVHSQTIPFANIIDVRNRVPVCSAYNYGMNQVKSDWYMHIAGDEILDKNAAERIIKHVETDSDDKTCGYFFGLQDTFLDWLIGYATMYRTEAYEGLVQPNWLKDDRRMNKKVRRRGWNIKKFLDIVVGTHFDKPSEFQIFSRFYPQTIKYMRYNMVRDRAVELLEKTGDPLYALTIRVVDFARKRKFYPGSKNNDFDKKLYEEFKNEDSGNLG